MSKSGKKIVYLNNNLQKGFRFLLMKRLTYSIFLSSNMLMFNDRKMNSEEIEQRLNSVLIAEVIYK